MLTFILRYSLFDDKVLYFCPRKKQYLLYFIQHIAMKKLSTLLLLSTLTITLAAQGTITMYGKVRELNSGNTPIETVQIEFSEGAPTSSDSKGNFELIFKKNTADYWSSLGLVYKKDYELVNKDAIDEIYVSDTEKKTIDIILAKTGVISAAKKVYNTVIDNTLKKAFTSQKEILSSQLSKGQLSASQYQERTENLATQFKKQEQGIDAFADALARTNIDDESPSYKEALDLFKAEKVDKAISKLEISVQDKQQALKNLQLLIKLYGIVLNIEKVDVQYAQLAAEYSDNVGILQQCADFHAGEQHIDQAQKLYQQIIEHPKAAEARKINAYTQNGNLYKLKNDMTNAIQMYIKSKDMYAAMCKKDPSDWASKVYLSLAYENIGLAYQAQEDLKNALAAFEECYKLDKALYALAPRALTIKRNLTISASHLAATYRSLGDLKSSLSLSEETNKLAKELYSDYPNDVELKNSLAISYQDLGLVHQDLGNLDRTLSLFEKYNLLRQELYTKYPDRVDFKKGLAMSYAQLARINSSVGDIKKALDYTEQEVVLAKELYDAYPNDSDLKYHLAAAYGELGELNRFLGNWEVALNLLEQCHTLSKELYATEPDNSNLKYALASADEKLGYINLSLGNLDKALDCFNDEVMLFEVLYHNSPENVDYKNNLGTAYSKLGTTYSKLENFDKAKQFFEKYNTMQAELYKAFPDNLDLKNNLAISFWKLATIALRLSKIEEVRKNASTFLTMTQELGNDMPTAVEFQANAAVAAAFLNGVELLSDAKHKKEDIDTSISTLNKIVAATKNDYYNRKVKVIEKMAIPNADIKALLLELTSF